MPDSILIEPVMEAPLHPTDRARLRAENLRVAYGPKEVLKGSAWTSPPTR